VAIGANHPRIDALSKVLGTARYPADLPHEGFLVAKVVFTNRPHARLEYLDIRGALKTPGVIDVITAADVPVNEYGLTVFDQPVLIGTEDSGRSAVPSNVSRWEADHLAAVIAESEETAHVGASRIVAEWRDLPLVPDLEAALRPDAPLIHPENGLDTNAYHHLKIRKGDLERGWDEAEIVISETYTVPHQEHAYLQPEAAIAYIDDSGRITVEIAGQWTHEDRDQIAHALDVDPETVRVIYPAIGGAFGGREDMSLQIVLALAVRKLDQRGIRRGVRAVWSREESIVGHHKRHRARFEARLGARRDGTITAVEVDAYVDAGAYNYTSNKVAGNVHLSVAGPYEIPNARIDTYAVYTTSVPGGAFRGFGAPQGAFVAENQVNHLAAALGMDPAEIRLKNALKDGSIGITQAEMPPGVSLSEVIRVCADAASGPMDPPATDRVRRGRGFACAYKNVGFSFGFPERCEARVVLHGTDAVDSVELFHAAADVGQGSHTALVQMAADAAGVEPPKVQATFSDTASSGDSGSASASRLTWMSGNAILGATEEATKRWIDGDRPAVGEFRYVPPRTETLDPETGVGQPNFAYGYVAEAVEVSVDIETGIVRIDRVVCANDVGKAVNPQLVVGQIEGAIAQAAGYALTENLIVENGRTINPRFSTYLIPGIGDVPPLVESIIVESADPRGPWGVRGMAEMPFIPLAPAVVAAVHDATGVWFNILPLTPPTVLEGLEAR